MARVLALVPDLLFGSRVKASLEAGGHDVALLSSTADLESGLRGLSADVLVVDLTDADLAGSEIVESLRDRGALAETRTIGFYSHVEAAVRERAEEAGFDLVVPRSRMAREGAELTSKLAAG